MENESTWLFLDDTFIKSSPSRGAKMTVQQELKQQESIHHFVIRLGSKLKLDGRTILAATVYINRYYSRMPITQSKYYVATAAIAISCKLHDNYRQPDKIALAGCNIKNPNQSRPLDEHSDIFWRWRDQLLFREELILKTINFDLNIDLPYNIRDELLREADNEFEDENSFFEKKPEIMKNTIALVEVLSSLPIFIAYDTYTIFGTALTIIIYEANLKFTEEKLHLPEHYLEAKLQVDSGMCWQCYQYVLRLLKYAKSDPNLVSNEVAIKRIPNLSQSQFEAIANGKQLQDV